ncbi:MAG: D-glycerate dehydrogenase [Gammaproteobacteria bacterium]|nr:D-glycerate dehydrogenase [Gammaproteobacteria bacterium]MDE0715277.1 D-glycerate dehydrogenase [Gammaproteobacteria bacterium]
MNGKKTRPVILVTRKLPPAVEARIARDYECILNGDDRLYDDAELVDQSDGVDAIVCCHTEHFTRAVIGQLPDSVRAIVNFSVGVDHCDLEAAGSKGIVVTNTPDVLSDATAEITMLCMLGAARRAGEGFHMVRQDLWHDWSPTFMLGTQVTGKRFGIVGMGRVGQVAARRARGFDMEIHYHNRRRLAPAAEQGAIYHETLESLLSVSDVLSLHCPNNPDSRGLLNAERIGQLPDGAIVVNTARGAVVDDEALVEALGSDRIRAAGLDVFNGEPDGIHPAYRELGNVFVLPHLGSATVETRDAMGFRALDNLDAIFAGREPADRVT